MEFKARFAVAAVATLLFVLVPAWVSADTPPDARAEARADAPVEVTPDRLAATWPTLLGRRVRLKSRIERAIGPSRVLVLAGGHRFLVNLSPERAWHGAQTHTFRVLGATRVSFHGKTVIVELTLDDDDTNQTNRTNQPNEEGG